MKNSEYSILDGAIRIPELIQHVKEHGMDSVAITDHGWMSGVVTFYKACKKAKIKPILGSEVYVTQDKDNQENRNRDNNHLVLLAKNNQGYSQLLRLVSNAYLNNFYYKPRVWEGYLSAIGQSGNVIATSACLGGILAKHLKFEKDQYGRAVICIDESGVVEKKIDNYLKWFGESFYLELQVWDDGSHFQSTYNEFLLNLGRRKGIPFVLTADCHYLKKEDEKLHEILMAMQMKMTLEQYRNSDVMQYGPYFYVASPEEMYDRAEEVGCLEAYNSTQDIAAQCNVEIELGTYKEPIFNIEEEEDYEDFIHWKEERNV